MLSLSNIKCSINFPNSQCFCMCLKMRNQSSQLTANQFITNGTLTFNQSLTIPINKTITTNSARRQKVIVIQVSQCEIMLYRIVNNKDKQTRQLMTIWVVEIGDGLLDGVKKRVKINNKADKGAFIQCEVRVCLQGCEEDCVMKLTDSMMMTDIISQKYTTQSSSCYQNNKILTSTTTPIHKSSPLINSNTKKRLLKITQLIEITCAPPYHSTSRTKLSEVSKQKSLTISETKSPKFYSKFNGKSKLFAFGLVKNQLNQMNINTQNVQKQQISTQTSEQQIQNHSRKPLHEFNQLQENLTEFIMNINGINFQQFASNDPLLSSKKSSSTLTFKPINNIIDEKYRKNEHFLKKYNQKLLQQLENLRKQNKRLLQQVSQKRYFTIEGYKQLQAKYNLKERQLQQVEVSLRCKNQRISELQMKSNEAEYIIDIQRQKQKQQRKSIAYFLKTSQLADEKIKQQSEYQKNSQNKRQLMPLIIASQQKMKNVKRRFQRTKNRDLINSDCSQLDSGDNLKSRSGGQIKSSDEIDIIKSKTTNNIVPSKFQRNTHRSKLLNEFSVQYQANTLLQCRQQVEMSLRGEQQLRRR